MIAIIVMNKRPWSEAWLTMAIYFISYILSREVVLMHLTLLGYNELTMSITWIKLNHTLQTFHMYYLTVLY